MKLSVLWKHIPPPIRTAIIVFFVVLVAGFLNPIKRNHAGERTHVERLTGKEFIRFKPGLYVAGIRARITRYPNVITVIFTDDKLKEPVTAQSPPFEIRFNDATKAEAECTVRYRLPNNEEDMISIHHEYRSPEKLAETTLTRFTRECLKYSAQLMESETHYSGGMSKMSEDFQDQLDNGQYVLELKTEYAVDSITKEPVKITKNYIRMGSDGLPQRNTSDIHQYNITVAIATVDQIDYEPQVDEKLAQKIEQSTMESVSKQTRITAEQEAATAEAKGRKAIAEAKATYEAEKIQAVIQAEKEKDVAQQQALQAKYIADKIIQEKRADAEGNKALRAAGLTPQEEMERDIKIADVVSKNIATAPTPQVVFVGSGGGNGADEALKVFGAERALELIKKMNQ